MAGATVEVWGSGERVVLVHGSLATGPMEWQGQRPLADEGYELVVPTRRAYTPGSRTVGEDFEVDGQDILDLLGDGAHLVGHSYGGLVALVAAAARPDAVRSLVLAEAPVFQVAADHPDVVRMRAEVEEILAHPGSDREFLHRFLGAVGTSSEAFPQEVLEQLVALTPALRRGRPPWVGPVPVERVAAASLPTVVVSGNHHRGHTAMCEALAQDLGARHVVVEGAAHEIQMVAEEFNAVLLSLWRE